LRSRGYRLGLLSNTWWAAAWHNADLAAHGLAPLFDTLVYTSDLNFSKPHHFVFEETARRLDVPVEACVMVGDRPVDDIAGAMSVGMRGVWKRNGTVDTLPATVIPHAIIDRISDMRSLLTRWGGD
jgi:putative hydrolase of the HAD superfamily